MKKIIKAPIIVVLMLVVDQISKLLAWKYLRGNDGFSLIPNIFELRYLENRSAAFGVDPIVLLQNLFHFSYFEENPQVFLMVKMVFFILLTAVVSYFIIHFYRKIPDELRFIPMKTALLAFLSGAIGNCIDRILHRYVIDFFYFKPINFPIFNVADIYVTVGAILFAFLWIIYYKEADFQKIYGEKDNH